MTRSLSILPQKHVRICESLLGIGALIISSLNESPKTLDALWADLCESDVLRERVNGSVDLDTVILGVDFLYLIGAVNLDKQGVIQNATA